MRVLVIILILLVLGLYFFTEATKGIIRTTGKATVNAAKGIVNEVKNSEEFAELKEDIKDKAKEELLKLKEGKNETKGKDTMQQMQ